MSPKAELNILSLEDSLRDFEIICERLIEEGFKMKISRVEKESDFASALRNANWDIILADFKLPGFNAFAALRISKEIRPDIPFICVSGSIGEETAIDLIKSGAVDYVLKDRLARLPVAINRSLQDAKEKLARRKAEEELKQRMDELLRFHNLAVGRELRMIELKKEVNELLRNAGQDEKYTIIE
ncbi:MAG TPA: response regulator [Prolixibacteraceae bacterium]|nr:response regulator [Prolixibacteraceae bacterium]